MTDCIRFHGNSSATLMSVQHFMAIHLIDVKIFHYKNRNVDLLDLNSRRAPKSLGFIIWAPRMAVKCFMAIHPKWQRDQLIYDCFQQCNTTTAVFNTNDITVYSELKKKSSKRKTEGPGIWFLSEKTLFTADILTCLRWKSAGGIYKINDGCLPFRWANPRVVV